MNREVDHRYPLPKTFFQFLALTRVLVALISAGGGGDFARSHAHPVDASGESACFDVLKRGVHVYARANVHARACEIEGVDGRARAYAPRVLCAQGHAPTHAHARE
eukprot:6185810-Pleurochrysis_carterae.AAC.2